MFNYVLYHTIKWSQVNQLVLNMEKTKAVKFSPANLLNCQIQITFGENLPVRTNALNV